MKPKVKQLTAKERYKKFEKSSKNDQYRKGVCGSAQVRPEKRPPEHD